MGNENENTTNWGKCPPASDDTIDLYFILSDLPAGVSTENMSLELQNIISMGDAAAGGDAI